MEGYTNSYTSFLLGGTSSSCIATIYIIDSGMSNTAHTFEMVLWLGRFTPVSICDNDVCDNSHFSASSYCVIESFFRIDLIAIPMFILEFFSDL